MLNTKPSTCFSYRRKPRRAYPDRTSADEGARNALSAHGKSMVPYRCAHCSSSHLSPSDRHTPSYYSSVCSKQVPIVFGSGSNQVSCAGLGKPLA